MTDESEPNPVFPGYPPPANFRLFLEGFIGQAMVALGKLPHPATNQSEVSIPWAKYFIDLLGLLEEKTRGNLEKDEQAILEGQLSMLRLTFVETQKEAAAQGETSSAGDDEGDAAGDS